MPGLCGRTTEAGRRRDESVLRNSAGFRVVCVARGNQDRNVWEVGREAETATRDQGKAMQPRGGMWWENMGRVRAAWMRFVATWCPGGQEKL